MKKSISSKKLMDYLGEMSHDFSKRADHFALAEIKQLAKQAHLDCLIDCDKQEYYEVEAPDLRRFAALCVNQYLRANANCDAAHE